MEIYTFDKSLQERLVEFSDILSGRGEVVPASQIRAEWSYHVELVIEPVGWQALWKIPRTVCQEFGIHYPTIVLVVVEQVSFDELWALTKITAVQDEIHLPEKYEVPLVELYPTLQQENNALDMVGTANCIDQLRFFFNYLWMPWDIDDDDNIDWVTTHLEPRLRLFFDMKRGGVTKETCDVIRTLIREGKGIQEKISEMEDTIPDEEELPDDVLSDGKACQLMKLHFRLQQIKTEMEVLENPTMRELLARNQSQTSTDRQTRNSDNKNRQAEAHFVWLGGTLEKMKEALEKIQSFLPRNMLMKTYGSLQDSLQACDVGDTVIVGDGTHTIRGTGGLEDGGTIRGLQGVENTVLSPKETESGPSFLDFSGNEVLVENVSIHLGELQVGVIARKGTVKIAGCKIFSSNQSMVKLGIVVLPGAKLIVEKTVFEGLGTAVVIYLTGEVVMDQCSFQNCAEGVQLQDNANLVAQNCLFSNLKEYGIRLETQKYLNGSECKSGKTDVLENVTEISLSNCKFEGNGKGDVLLKPRQPIGLVTKQNGAMSTDV